MISVFAANSPVLSVMAEPPIFNITGFASFNYPAPLHELLNHLLKSITETAKKPLLRIWKNVNNLLKQSCKCKSATS
jgi:hypothetical protein